MKKAADLVFCRPHGALYEAGLSSTATLESGVELFYKSAEVTVFGSDSVGIAFFFLREYGTDATAALHNSITQTAGRVRGQTLFKE